MKALSAQSIRERAKARGEPAWLVESRVEAYERYLKMDAPRWRRTDLGSLDVEARALSGWAHDAPRDRPRHRPAGTIHLGLAEAAREHESLVRPLMAVSPRADKWEVLAAALWTSGDFLLVERGREVAEPVTVESRFAAQGGFARDVMVVERAAKAHVVERLQGGGADAFVGVGLELDVRDGANLQLSTLQDLAAATTLLANRRARLQRDARLEWVDGQFGAGTSVTQNESVLVGPGGNLRFIGAFFGSAGQHMDITTSALHEADHTSSQLDMKGALTEDGYSANYSIVNIGPQARNSSGHQKQETLLLSPRARADAIPKLDVENNDVSASHGATVGQVDPEQLFYLRARGFTDIAAKRLIVEGFFDPLLREIPIPAVQDELRSALVGRLKG